MQGIIVIPFLNPLLLFQMQNFIPVGGVKVKPIEGSESYTQVRFWGFYELLLFLSVWCDLIQGKALLMITNSRWQFRQIYRQSPIFSLVTKNIF